MSDTPNTIVTYGDNTFDLATLPPASVAALVRRGIAHYLGNEMASKVTSWKEALAKQTPPVVPTDDEVITKRAEFNAAGLQAIAEGKIGMGRTAGPSKASLTPTEAIVRRLAKEEVIEVLKKNNLVFPRGDKTVSIGGNAFSAEDLIARRVAQHGERLGKLASAELKAKAKRLEAAATGGDVAADLGL